ncbi:plasmid recombination protein [Vibrio parahaemolyticus]|uniref:plasmid recombination protein n=1 Tax=Vibrio parahaemolyticus TaxID=670 RepID=UPI00235F1933|nr:plasmid recombination protein [Vibrio parahaemolyticus]
MAGYQFIHVDTYPLVSTKQKPSMLSIVSEAARVEGYCPHVQSPERPILLFGIDPTKLTKIASDRVKQAKDKSGRKVRKDAPVLLAGVASLPYESTHHLKGFIDSTLNFLRKRYGDNLMSVLLHLDESPHPHLHFFVLPTVADGRINISQVHCGVRARNDCTGSYSKKAAAYKKAMRRFQDDYYTEVSSKLGLTRIGPKVQRLTRKEWQAQKTQAVHISKTQHSNLQKEKELARNKQQLDKSLHALRVRESELTTIENGSLFQKSNQKKNRYLKRRLLSIANKLRSTLQKLDEAQKALFLLKKEISGLKSQNASYTARFEALRYKNEVKDRRIKDLMYNNNNKGNSNEKYTTISSNY